MRPKVFFSKEEKRRFVFMYNIGFPGNMCVYWCVFVTTLGGGGGNHGLEKSVVS